MREIKFRAWFELEKKMVESENLGFQYEGDEEERFTFAFDKMTVDENGNEKGTMCFTPMQYTGLKDKNGREIYEGDIIKCFVKGDSKVVFKHGCFCLESLNYGNVTAFCDIFGAIEIIGNIYENPELLEDK